MKNILWIGLLLFSTTLSAQLRLFEKGYVIQNAGDTIHGYIQNDGEANISTQIIFKKTEKSKEKSFAPSAIKSFFLKETGSKFVVKQHKYKDGDLEVSEQLFVKVLVSGYLSLYRLQFLESQGSRNYPISDESIFDMNNDFIYLIEKDGKLTKLEIEEVLKEQVNLQTVYVKRKKYIGMLKYTLQDCPDLMIRINDKLPFKDKSIIDIVERYNKCKSPDTEMTIYKNQKRRNIITNNVLISANHNRGVAVDYLRTFSSFKKNRNTSIVFGIGVHRYIPDYRSVYINRVRTPVLAQYQFGKSENFQPYTFAGFHLYYQKASLSRGGVTLFIPEPQLVFGLGAKVKSIRADFFVENIRTKAPDQLYSSTNQLSFRLGYSF